MISRFLIKIIFLIPLEKFLKKILGPPSADSPLREKKTEEKKTGDLPKKSFFR